MNINVRHLDPAALRRVAKRSSRHLALLHGVMLTACAGRNVELSEGDAGALRPDSTRPETSDVQPPDSAHASSRPSSARPRDAGASAPPIAKPARDAGANRPGDAGVGPQLVYRLTAEDIFLPPVTHLRGITFDGTRFWLLRGDHNALEHTLVEWDPSSAQLLRSFTYENLIEVAGTGVYGLGWDGSTVWISVSGNTNKLVQVQPEDGAILRTLGSPSVLGPSDLEFFDGALWLSTGTGRAYRVDTSSQTVEFSFPVFEEIGRDSGIAVRSGELWVSGLFGGLRVYHPSTGALMGEVDVQSDFPLSALCFAEGQLVSVEERGIVFYGIEPLLTPEL